MAQEAVSGVLTLAREWAFPASSEAAERLGVFMRQLLKWNERVNLTGARELRELLGDHIPDSFALAKLCPEGANVVDIGSGGGLPAIPFAILRPDCRVTLVEPRAKRIAFLNAAGRACDCRNVEVLRARVEEMPDSGYSVATSRATFSPEVWLGLAPRLLAPGGMAVVFATSRVGSGPPSAKLLESIEYRTAGGTPRWSGCFCFL
jgi:16S rRNA (guanine527-N7)-methyltransferase